MPQPILVNDLLDQVRDQLDETNTVVVDDDDILQALNRAQRHAANITAKHYDELFMALTTFTSTANSDSYPIPEDAFGERVKHVLVENGGYDYPLRYINFRQIQRFTSDTQVQIPSSWSIVGKNIIIKPKPSGSVTFKVYYTKIPEILVKSLGRITSIDTGTSTTEFYVDSIDSSLTTSVDNLGAFINVVNQNTGEIRGTFQIAAIDETAKKVTIKDSGLARSSVYQNTVSTTLAVTDTIQLDDYICSAKGVAVPQLPGAYTDHLIQYAVVEIRRRFGEPLVDEKEQLSRLEREVERMWTAREASLQIARKNKHFLRG